MEQIWAQDSIHLYMVYLILLVMIAIVVNVMIMKFLDFSADIEMILWILAVSFWILIH